LGIPAFAGMTRRKRGMTERKKRNNGEIRKYSKEKK